MGKLVMLLVGIAIGLGLARTGRGRAALDAGTASVHEFTQTVTDSYRARLAETGVDG